MGRILLLIIFPIVLAVGWHAPLVNATESSEDPTTFYLDTLTSFSAVNVTFTIHASNPLSLDRFDFVLVHNPVTLPFLYASPAGAIADWEYFSYRHEDLDSCSGECPYGLIRLTGVADLPDGNDPGDIYTANSEIARLTFRMPESLYMIGQCQHVSWYWSECADNSVTSVDNDSTFVSLDIETLLPEADCLNSGTMHPALQFTDGIVCNLDLGERGDINLNGAGYEIGDAIIFANYFIYGPPALGYGIDLWYDNRVLESDIDDDGNPLTLGDFVCLVCMISSGDSQWECCGGGYKLNPLANSAKVIYTTGEMMSISTETNAELAAATFVFDHHGIEIGTPVLTGESKHMILGWSDRDAELRVLVYSLNGQTLAPGLHELFTVPMTGGTSIELKEVQICDIHSTLLTVDQFKAAGRPQHWQLQQNYPNPFNASTVIRFSLPEPAQWNLRIYNIVGQVIDQFSGQSAAGDVALRWEADNSPSGIYFYRVEAKGFTDTRKMVLMK